MKYTKVCFEAVPIGTVFYFQEYTFKKLSRTQSSAYVDGTLIGHFLLFDFDTEVFVASPEIPTPIPDPPLDYYDFLY